MAEIPKTQYDLIYLAGCVLRQTEPDPARVGTMDLQEVFHASCAASLEGTAWRALEPGKDSMDPELVRAWQEAAGKVLRKAVFMDLERKSLYEDLEEMGCWYLPLKGAVMESLYPAPGLRQMTDTDILFDRRFRRQVAQRFRDAGYQVESLERSNHDVYGKPPLLEFEMHVDLFGRGHQEPWALYWEGIQDRLLPAEGGSFRRQMSREDFYLFQIAHSYKHYLDLGIGLKNLMDIWLLLRQKELDLEAVERGLEAMGLQDYGRVTRSLAQQIFRPDFKPEDLSAEEQEMLSRCLLAGGGGNLELRLKNSMEAIGAEEGKITLFTRLRYLWRRTVTGTGEDPRFWHRVGFLWGRIYRALKYRRGQVFRELSMLFKMK